ncbi:MAG: hypothetical protein M0R46_14865 [Candidatus Muirbacterium halophilum]|nr:hypothetical protein [Candidatus Muirbacterium halophilum]
MEYNRKGLMTNLTDAESNNTTFEYNLYNLPVNIKNAMNISSEYKYNKDNSLENIINNSIQKIDLKRDIYGNIVSLRDEDGNIKEYTYDNNNNITSRKLKNSEKILKEENYGYDHNNQLEYFRSGDTEYNLSRDIYGNITEITGKENIKLEYTKDNKIAKIKKADDVIEYMYDKAGRMKEIRNGDSSQRFDYNSDMNLESVERDGRKIEFGYTDSGRKESIIYPNGIKKEITYTANGLVSSEKVSNKDKEIFKAEYVYNRNNSLIEKKEYVESKEEKTLYEYDNIGRLIKVKYPDNETEEFMYDSNGNRIMYNSVSKGKVKYSYNNLGRLSKIETMEEERDLSTEYIYDSEGNLIEKRGAESLSLRYDNPGRLIRAEKDGNTVEYAYDVFGNRTERKVSGKNPVTERFSYAGSNIFEIKTGDGEIKEKYISGQNIDEIYGKIESNGNEEYYIRDYLGNIKAIFDKDGIMKDYRRYRAYGVEEKEPKNGFGFTSREYDEITGLYYYRSRYYDPTIGRFLQKDKYNEAGLLSNDPSVVYNPSQLNNYAYVANNPVNYVDPNGEAVMFLFIDLSWNFIIGGQIQISFAIDHNFNTDILISSAPVAGAGTPNIGASIGAGTYNNETTISDLMGGGTEANFGAGLVNSGISFTDNNQIGYYGSFGVSIIPISEHVHHTNTISLTDFISDFVNYIPDYIYNDFIRPHFYNNEGCGK